MPCQPESGEALRARGIPVARVLANRNSHIVRWEFGVAREWLDTLFSRQPLGN